MRRISWPFFLRRLRVPNWGLMLALLFSCMAALILASDEQLLLNWWHRYSASSLIIDGMLATMLVFSMLRTRRSSAKADAITNQLASMGLELERLAITGKADHLLKNLGAVSEPLVHNLTGSMHTINFCVQLLRERKEASIPEKYLEQLEMSSRKSLDIISELKNLLQYSGGNYAPAPPPRSLA